MVHISLDAMASYARRTTGDVPPPLVGASVTFYEPPGTPSQPSRPSIIVFGGRRVTLRRVVSTMYILDLMTLVWERVSSGLDDNDAERVDGQEARVEEWPAPRYFHTADIWQDKLIVFGGMGYQSIDQNSAPNSGSSNDSPISQSLETPRVLSDIHIFDCVARRWMHSTQEVNRNPSTSSTGGVVPDSGVMMTEGEEREGEDQDLAFVPTARYAHLSAVSRDCLIIIGGQNLDDEYVTETSAFDLVKQRWTGHKVVPDEHRGSYRSLSVSSRHRVTNPAVSLAAPTSAVSTDPSQEDTLIRLPYTMLEEGGGGDIYTFSNSNFTDVKRELQVISPNANGNPAEMRVTDLTALMKGAPTLPPGLRFPFGAILGHHLIIAGTYLSSSVQQFSTWALDLWTWEWTKIDAIAMIEGSWNKAVLWEDEAKLVIFGSMDGDLNDDYEHRCVNFDHVALTELEIYGLYQPPLPSSTKAEYQPLALQLLHSSVNTDFEIVCEDGRSVRCSRTILLQRWPWFKLQFERAQAEAADLLDEAVRGSGRTELPITLSSTRLTPKQLHLSEPYPVVLAFLEYLYSESLLTTLQHRPPILSALMMVSKQYHIPALRRLVAHAMHERLNEVTALGVYEIATLCEEKCLQVRALKIVLRIQKRAQQVKSNNPGASGSAIPASGSKVGNLHAPEGAQTSESLQTSTNTPAASDAQSTNLPGTQQQSLQTNGLGTTTGRLLTSVNLLKPPKSIRTSELFSRDYVVHMAPAPSPAVPAAPTPVNDLPLGISMAHSGLFKTPRSAPVQQSTSPPGLTRAVPLQEMSTAQVGLNRLAGGDGSEDVVIEYSRPPGASLMRSASLTSVHHFSTSDRVAKPYRASRQGPRSAVSGPSAGTGPRIRTSRENIVDHSPLSSEQSDAFTTLSAGPVDLRTPADSPGSGWPLEPFHGGGHSSRKVPMTPSMDAIHEQSRHQRGASESSWSSTGLAYLSEKSTPPRVEMRSLGSSATDIHSTMRPVSERSKMRRPPTIDTQIARADFGAKMSLLVHPRSPYSDASTQTSIEATTIARGVTEPRIGRHLATPWKASDGGPAVGDKQLVQQEPSILAESVSRTSGYEFGKEPSQRRRLLSEPDKSSKSLKEKLQHEKSGKGFGRIARAMTASARDIHI